MRLRNLTFALFALLAVPAGALAGPIDFRYTATHRPYPFPGPYSPGELHFSLTPEGNVSRPAGGSVELGAVELGLSPGPVAPTSYTAYSDFDVSVTVIDAVTGQSGVLTLTDTAVDWWDYRAWDGRWLNTYHHLAFGDVFADNTDSTSAVIGHTRYTLSVRPENDNQVGVYTLSATVANPEPGTLALAALGLVPLGLRRLRRSQ
jgi:hypothetical protein